jgi:YYY domain-containing protein
MAVNIQEREVAPEQTQSVATRRALPAAESLALLPLLLVLLLGGVFRFTGLNWDENQHLHPDERFLTDVANRLQPVDNPLDYLRPSVSTLNPYNAGIPTYVYGNFPMTVTRYVGGWVQEACVALSLDCAYRYDSYDGIHLVGRVLSGLLDLVSVFFIFLIGRRLYDWRVGLLAALLLAVAVMPIQQSHFFTMDNWAAGLTTAALYMAVRAGEEGDRWRWWLLFGLFLGLAVASRVNVAPLAAMAGVAALIWVARQAPQGAGWRYLLSHRGSEELQRVFLGVLLAGFISLLTFRLAQPYAFADGEIIRQAALAETGQEPSALRVAFGSIIGFHPEWRADMAEIQGLQQPEASFPPALQWTGRAPLFFPLNNMVLYGMGITAGIAAWLGFFWALSRIARAGPDWTAHALPVAWSGLYFLFMGTRWVTSIRYFLPIYPTLLLLGAWALIAVCQFAAARPPARRRLEQLGAAALILAAVVPTFLWANAFVDIYRQPLTRLAASRWIFDNIPTGATLVYEAAGEEHELHLPLRGFNFAPGTNPLHLAFDFPDQGGASGTARALRFNYLSTMEGGASDAHFALSLLGPDSEPLEATSQAVTVGRERSEAELPLPAATLAPGEMYVFRVSLESGTPLHADTSVFVNEEWDDLLPASVDGRPAYATYYREVAGGQRPLPWPASDDKRRLMLDWLDEADVIAISSQRSLWNTPRLPLTFPLNIAYYEALFSGELGFDLVAEFHATPRIGPLYISDTAGKVRWGEPPDIGWPPPGELAAEEAFSVYDHPPVWIFQKNDRYSHERALAILGAVDLGQVVVMNPAEASRAPNAMMLPAARWERQQATGTFSQLFDLGSALNRQPWLAAAVWWLAVVALGWLTFPLAYAIFRGLPGRGYALSRILGLLVVSWLGWILASYQLLPHDRTTLWLSLLLLAVTGLLLFLRQRSELVGFVRSRAGYLLLVEGLGLALFLFALLLRLGNPDVWDVIWGGEKPMDLSYFTAVLKSRSFPPYDPWYAGGYINYYYYGFVFAGVLPKMLGIAPTIAYNLALAMIFSFTGLAAFSLAYNLVAAAGAARQKIGNIGNLGNLGNLGSLSRRAAGAGLLAVLLALFLGNIGQPGVVAGAWYRAGDAQLNSGVAGIDALVRTLDGAIDMTLRGEPAPIYPGDWFWTTTRAISVPEGETGPITEFPFFTFLYGDLHAHMIALPLTLLALAWAVSLVLSAKPDRPPAGWVAAALRWFAGGLAIGVLRATNTWDWPTYLLTGMLAAGYYAFARRRQFSLPAFAQALIYALFLAGLSTLLFWPYITSYGSGYESFRLWQGPKTSVADYLVIHGLFLFLVATYLVLEFRAWSRTWTQAKLERLEPLMWPGLLALVAYVLILVVLLLRGVWVAPLVLTLALLAFGLALRPSLSEPRRIVLILIAGALALTLLVEVVVLDGDIGRMNTVFKFYMQVWLLFSVAAAAGAAWVWPAIRQHANRTTRRVWYGVLALLVASAALYPLLATPAKWQIRMSDEAPLTLDGMAFMETTSYGDTAFDGSGRNIHLRGEYEALRWLQANVEGTPVLAEAHGGNPYRSITNRVAMYTGLPAIVGWDWHQRQQRASVPDRLVWDRVADVNRLFSSAQPGEALQVLRKYDVGYVYLGTIERAYYPPDGIAKFEQLAASGYLREVFQNEDVTIYKVDSVRLGQSAVGGSGS